MPTGDCFNCHQPGHWARDCPLKTSTNPHAPPLPADTASPPVIHCPDHGGACKVFTSTTVKNPNRKFYKCPEAPNCRFFKWCDQVSIVEPEPISVNPTCPCVAGPCRRVTVMDGPDANRSYFVCCIKKGFGACEFFQWEDDVVAQTPSEHEEVGHGGSPCSTLIGFSDSASADDENPTPSNHFTHFKPREKEDEGNGVVDGIAKPVTLPVNVVTVGKESSRVCSNLNNLEPVYNGVFASIDTRNQVCKDAVRFETEEQVLPSLAPKHIEPQVEALCSDHPTKGAILGFPGQESYELEMVKAMRGLGATGFLHNTSDKPEHQSTTFGETRASFSGGSYLMDLFEKYNSEKLHFETISTKHVEAMTAFTGSYKQLESVRHRAHSLRKQLLEVENIVKLYEAETSEFATSLLQVSGEMVKSQRRMVETAVKVAKEVRVYKQRDFAAL